MNNFKKVITNGEPSAEDKRTLVAGMLAHHSKNGHERVTESMSIFYRDENDKAVAGVMLSFLWKGMEIQSLWVDESLRGQGIGKELMHLAEEEGIKRGCTVAYTNTFTWQAPEFYKKMGYEMFGNIADFPEGSSLSYFAKKL